MANPSSDPQLDKIIASFLVSVESGGQAEIDTLCEKYPDHAEKIRAYFLLQKKLFESLDQDAAIDSKQPPVSPLGSFNHPTHIEGFEIKELIGKGGMGVVFEAIEKELQRPVAIKFLKDWAHESEDQKRRFDDEAKIIAQFQHENIVDVLRVGTHQGRPYMVMPLIKGKSLHQAIQERPLNEKVAALVMAKVADAIKVAHQQNIVHRDIKPANVLCGESVEDCKVTDFGIANWETNDEGLTETGEIMGTVGYIAPEIIDGKSKGDRLTDIYSLGATLYALLVGHVNGGRKVRRLAGI